MHIFFCVVLCFTVYLFVCLCVVLLVCLLCLFICLSVWWLLFACLHACLFDVLLLCFLQTKSVGCWLLLCCFCEWYCKAQAKANFTYLNISEMVEFSTDGRRSVLLGLRMNTMAQRVAPNAYASIWNKKNNNNNVAC